MSISALDGSLSLAAGGRSHKCNTVSVNLAIPSTTSFDITGMPESPAMRVRAGKYNPNSDPDPIDSLLYF